MSTFNFGILKLCITIINKKNNNIEIFSQNHWTFTINKLFGRQGEICELALSIHNKNYYRFKNNDLQEFKIRNITNSKTNIYFYITVHS